mgnify:CR=1 FL=1
MKHRDAMLSWFESLTAGKLDLQTSRLKQFWPPRWIEWARSNQREGSLDDQHIVGTRECGVLDGDRHVANHQVSVQVSGRAGR